MIVNVKTTPVADKRTLSTARGTKIFDAEKGDELKYVERITIHPLDADSLLRADIRLLIRSVEVDGALARYVIIHPKTGAEIDIVSVRTVHGDEIKL